MVLNGCCWEDISYLKKIINQGSHLLLFHMSESPNAPKDMWGTAEVNHEVPSILWFKSLKPYIKKITMLFLQFFAKTTLLNYMIWVSVVHQMTKPAQQTRQRKGVQGAHLMAFQWLTSHYPPSVIVMLASDYILACYLHPCHFFWNNQAVTLQPLLCKQYIEK